MAMRAIKERPLFKDKPRNALIAFARCVFGRKYSRSDYNYLRA